LHETIIDDKDIVKTRKKWRRLVLILLASGITLSAAVAIDFNEFFPPPDDDVSAFGPLLTDGESHNFGTPAYQGSIEGSSIQQVEQNKVIQEDNNGEFKIPTGGAPSPLFDAVEFNQKMFRFEEFGSDQLAGAPAGPVFPSPQSAVRGPVEQELDDFLCDGPVNGARPECNRGLSPFPRSLRSLIFLGVHLTVRQQKDALPAKAGHISAGENSTRACFSQRLPQKLVTMAECATVDNDTAMASLSAGERSTAFLSFNPVGYIMTPRGAVTTVPLEESLLLFIPDCPYNKKNRCGLLMGRSRQS